MLKDRISLFIPELPGYGISSLPPQSDKRTVGTLIVKALHSVYGKERKIIWCGHDRGGRVGHRLLVDNDASHNIVSGILMDIVPTLEQFRAFANPKASVAYSHWPFLATDYAPAMIEAMGGRLWCNTALSKIKGGNPAGVEKFKENDAFEHYCHQFSQPDCISGSCADYAAGATIDCDEQAKDQEAGRKVKVPLCVMYSANNLGSIHDVSAVWKNWASGEVNCIGIPDGYGHYLPEEAPELIAEKTVAWLNHVGV